MTVDSRVVQSGEIQVGTGLDGVVVDGGASSSTAGTVSSSQKEFGEYMLDASLILFLNSITTPDRIQHLSNAASPSVRGLLGDKSIEALVASLKSDFFTLDDLAMVPSRDDLFLAGNLRVASSIPHDSFQRGLSAFLGGDDIAKYMLTTDVALSLGLGDTTKPVNLEDPGIQSTFPQLSSLKNFNGRYLISKDPYLLLLSLSPEYRRFLSACIDEAKKNSPSTPPFSGLGNVNSSLEGYGLKKENVVRLAQNGFLGLPTIAKTGHQYGVKDLKQYLGVVSKLKENLSMVAR
jgi:hypothetical protein